MSLSPEHPRNSAYRALATTATEIIWIQNLLGEMGILHQHPTTLYCDNTSAISLGHNPVMHAKTKHNDVDCH